MMVNIELDKVYKVRMGGLVKIKYADYTNLRPFGGEIKHSIGKGHISIAFFTINGMYAPEKGQHSFDIEKEWTDKEDAAFEEWLKYNSSDKIDISTLRNIFDVMYSEDNI